jgi:hypothetical protein
VFCLGLVCFWSVMHRTAPFLELRTVPFWELILCRFLRASLCVWILEAIDNPRARTRENTAKDRCYVTFWFGFAPYRRIFVGFKFRTVPYRIGLTFRLRSIATVKRSSLGGDPSLRQHQITETPSRSNPFSRLKATR